MNKIQVSEEPSQSEVLTLMEQKKCWMNSDEVDKDLKIGSRDKAAKFLRKLWKFNFLERRKQPNSVVLEYKIVEK
jgi:predicted transcriptional regulator